MNMTAERFKEIVAAYGSSSEHWPESERAEATTYLSSSIEAQHIVCDASELDSLLSEFQVPEFPGLQEKVLNQILPPRSEGIIEYFLDWILPQSQHSPIQLWRPALVACLPLLFGLFLGTQFTFGIDELDNSWDVELALLSLNDFSEPLETLQ